MNKTSAVLGIIYDTFADWTAGEQWACGKGCSSCCTQNVAITAAEGTKILDFVREHNMEEWLVERLQGDISPHRPHYTINTLAKACLEGREIAEEQRPGSLPCPFLTDGSCAIYMVRPFACRCFLSLHTCSPARPALISAEYLAAATAINQIIEHLGQRGYWGNMLDVLPALLKSSGPMAMRFREGAAAVTAARGHTLRSQPLPGFMLEADDHARVAPLLENIFAATIDGQTVEDILNGA